MNLLRHFTARNPAQRVKVLLDAALREQKQAQYTLVEARDNLHAAEAGLAYSNSRVELLMADWNRLREGYDLKRWTASEAEPVANSQQAD